MTSRQFIPNSFQIPNIYVDVFMSLLTPEEFKVLIYFARRIFGSKKIQDRVSISQLTNGNQLDGGTGLGESTNRKSVASLVVFGLLLRVADNDPFRNEGALFELQLDADLVNLEGLQIRLAKKDAEAWERMQKARKAIMSTKNYATAPRNSGE
jgi:hypothetical protein